MAITHTSDPKNTRIYIDGELGHHEAIEMMDRIREIIDLCLPRQVLLDLSGLAFMDSSGIAVLVQTSRLCREIGAEFAVEGVPRQAMRILSAAGLDKLIAFV